VQRKRRERRYSRGAAQRTKAAAWRAMVEAQRNAWRNPPSAPATGDPWFDAVAACAERDDVEPLVAYLHDFAAGRAALNAEHVSNLASLLRLLHARGRKRKRGKPGGTWRRWQIPDYWAAAFAEWRIAVWKRDNGKRHMPNATLDQTIVEEVAKIGEWHFAKDRKPTVGRVKAILKGPRNRRLLPMPPMPPMMLAESSASKSGISKQKTRT
jgi:hypothetical protein